MPAETHLFLPRRSCLISCPCFLLLLLSLHDAGHVLSRTLSRTCLRCIVVLREGSCPCWERGRRLGGGRWSRVRGAGAAGQLPPGRRLAVGSHALTGPSEAGAAPEPPLTPTSHPSMLLPCLPLTCLAGAGANAGCAVWGIREAGGKEVAVMGVLTV